MVTPLNAVPMATKPTNHSIVTEDIAQPIQPVQQHHTALVFSKEVLERFVNVVQIVQGGEAFHGAEK